VYAGVGKSKKFPFPETTAVFADWYPLHEARFDQFYGTFRYLTPARELMTG